MLNLEELQELVRSGETPEYLFFWGHTPSGSGPGPWCLSQWYESPFAVEGVSYNTAEHFMMAGKAALFGDEETREAILKAKNPGAAKKLGRQVRGFDEERWVARRQQLVVEGNLAKFGQDEALCAYLLKTGDRVLVEASPRDRIWGIGLAATDERAASPETWRGLNLLGFALVEVRRLLREGR